MTRLRAALPRLIIAALCAGTAAQAHAFGKGDKGTSGAPFLKLAPGARAVGMGEAFGGVADDVHAVHYNPAGLGGISRIELAAMHNSHFQGIKHNFGAIAVPMLSWVDTREARNRYGTLALSLTSLSVDGIERRGLVETDEPEGTFQARDFAYTLGYGIKVSSRLAAGGALKLIRQTIDSEGASAFAVDAGVQYRKRGLSVGGGLRNLGSAVTFRSEGDPLPLLLYGSAAYELRPEWLAALELRLPRDNSVAFSLGTEYRRALGDELEGALRMGYNTAYSEADGFGGVTFGAGATYRRVTFDFAWVPFGELGSTFRYSILLKF